jgi:hypothetical protein
VADRYDPIPDLITYMVRSRKSMTKDAGYAQLTLMQRLGITADTDQGDAARLIREAIRQAREGGVDG